jgi:hypothetical protein
MLHSPVRRPRAAALGHVADVHNLEMCAPLLLALDAHRVSAGTRGGERGLIVGTHDECVARCIGQVEALSRSLVDVAVDNQEL